MSERRPSRTRPADERGWKSQFLALRNIPRFFRLIWQTHPALTLTNILLRLMKALFPVAQLWVGKLIIDEVVAQMQSADKDMDQLLLYVGIELALAILSDFASRMIGLTDGLLGDLYSNSSSVALIHQAAKMELSQLEDAEFYDKLERARRQTTSRVSLMSNVLSQGQDLITVASLIAGLTLLEPWLILLLIVAIIPSFINEIKFSRSSYSLARSWTPERRELDYLRYIGASDVTAKEVKLFGLADFLSGRFAVLAHKYYLANRKLNIKRSVFGSIFHLIGDLAYYGGYLFIIFRTVAGVLTLGELTFLSGSFNRLRNQLQAIFSRFTMITESALYLQDYFDFMDLKPEEAEGYGTKTPPSDIKEGFRFESVSFQYPGAENYVLRDISFTLQAGEKLALVGENGAGKTTLVKLLLRLYEPTSGRITLDGTDIREFDKSKYQELFGAIFQDYVKYYFTAKENIGVGKIEELENAGRIAGAAERSLADEVIEALPERYDQPLGKRFANGKELSGGQWQKIALARAYMKDASVIILDEPTAALDARAEFEAFERFVDLTLEKTAVIISHRFSTVRMADRILVLSGGSILELGTHEELLKGSGLYAELFSLQARGYQ